MAREHIEFFKSSIMIWTPKLHTLMLIRGYISDDEVPQLSLLRFMEAKAEERVRHTEKRIEKEIELELKRVELVTDLFSHNREMMLRFRNVMALRYIGIGANVYCCMAAVPEGSEVSAVFEVKSSDATGISETEAFHIVKLSPDQARSFDAVKRLDMEVSTWW